MTQFAHCVIARVTSNEHGGSLPLPVVRANASRCRCRAKNRTGPFSCHGPSGRTGTPCFYVRLASLLGYLDKEQDRTTHDRRGRGRRRACHGLPAVANQTHMGHSRRPGALSGAPSTGSATRTHRPSVLSCTRGKLEGARAWSGSAPACAAAARSTEPGTRAACSTISASVGKRLKCLAFITSSRSVVPTGCRTDARKNSAENASVCATESS